jgi:hypothetical protein
MRHDSVERTLRIGFGIKRASGFKVESPQFHGFTHPLKRCKTIPLLPRVRIEPGFLESSDSLLVIHGTISVV